MRFVSVGGAGAGAVGMWIVVIVDGFNVREALGQREPGMAALYVARLLPEIGLGASMGWSLYTLIVDGAAAELFGGPVAWILTGCIVIVSVIIDLVKDPETLKWSKQCYFGSDPNYGDDASREQKDFANAIANR